MNIYLYKFLYSIFLKLFFHPNSKQKDLEMECSQWCVTKKETHQVGSASKRSLFIQALEGSVSQNRIKL